MARFRVGLTGGIGSGKSLVAQWLAEWGAAVIDTDVIARALTSAGGAAMAPLRQVFGNGIADASGALDRAAMRERVFADDASRQQLEGVLHPMIRDEVARQAGQVAGAYLVVVVPLLAESGRRRGQFDRICVVDCDSETQIARVQARNGLTRELIGRIMSAQAARQDRLAIADDVLLNDAHTTVEQLRLQARQLHDQWRQGDCAAQANPPSVRRSR